MEQIEKALTSEHLDWDSRFFGYSVSRIDIQNADDRTVADEITRLQAGAASLYTFSAPGFWPWMVSTRYWSTVNLATCSPNLISGPWTEPWNPCCILPKRYMNWGARPADIPGIRWILTSASMTSGACSVYGSTIPSHAGLPTICWHSDRPARNWA